MFELGLGIIGLLFSLVFAVAPILVFAVVIMTLIRLASHSKRGFASHGDLLNRAFDLAESGLDDRFTQSGPRPPQPPPRVQCRYCDSSVEVGTSCPSCGAPL